MNGPSDAALQAAMLPYTEAVLSGQGVEAATRAILAAAYPIIRADVAAEIIRQLREEEAHDKWGTDSAADFIEEEFG